MWLYCTVCNSDYFFAIFRFLALKRLSSKQIKFQPLQIKNVKNSILTQPCPEQRWTKEKSIELFEFVKVYQIFITGIEIVQQFRLANLVALYLKICDLKETPFSCSAWQPYSYGIRRLSVNKWRPWSNLSVSWVGTV